MKFTATFLVLLPLCAALGAPKQFVRKLEPEQDLKSQVNALAALTNHDQSRQLTDSCPDCVTANTVAQEQQGNVFNSLLSKVQNFGGEGSTLSTLKNALTTAAEGALGEQINAQTILPILITAGTEFATLVASTQSMKSDAAVTADTSGLVMAIFNLLESIVSAIANLIISIIKNVEVAVVSLIAGVIIAILNLIENIILSIINIIVSFFQSIFGLSANSVTGSTLTLKTKATLAAGALGGVYSNAMDFLSAGGDESGLIGVLAASSADMVNVQEKLSAFLDTVDAAGTTDVAIQGDTVTSILNLIVEIIARTLNLVVSIITNVLFLIANIVAAVLKLISSIIGGIIGLIVSILNAIVGIFSLEADSVSSDSLTLTAVVIMTKIVTSPLTQQFVECQLNLPACPVAADEVGCTKDMLTCENDALAAVAF
jgi:hypothetical protein